MSKHGSMEKTLVDRVKNSAVSDFQSVDENTDEYTEIEAEILAFCEK